MAEPKLCGECGAIHRPGENTLCPGWRPGPFVPSPQPVMVCPACVLDVPLSKAATESIAAELSMRGLHVIDAKQKAVLDALLCSCCGEQKPDLEEYTGCTGGPICKACHAEWRAGQRENPEW